MNPTELRELDEQRLVEQISTLRRDLFGQRFQHATGELENTAGLRSKRRELARAITVARQRGIDVDRDSA